MTVAIPHMKQECMACIATGVKVIQPRLMTRPVCLTCIQLRVDQLSFSYLMLRYPQSYNVVPMGTVGQLARVRVCHCVYMCVCVRYCREGLVNYYFVSRTTSCPMQ